MGAVKFDWKNHSKRSGSFFTDTSPEFDFGVYTLCLLTRFQKSNLARSCKVGHFLTLSRVDLQFCREFLTILSQDMTKLNFNFTRVM